MKVIRPLVKLLALLLLMPVAANLILVFVVCPVYDFPAPEPFSGDSYYNPYEEISDGDWLKGNFHAHTRTFWGLMNGRKNSAEAVRNRYSDMGYDIIGISDYMGINRTFEDQPMFIPVYEHGYNYNKTHQLVLGAERVQWLDFQFVQTIHSKQFMLDTLGDDGELTVINHPKRRDGYPLDQLYRLGGFQLVEIWSTIARSTLHWDSLLSAGKPVFAMGNDDCHDIYDINDYGVAATVVFAEGKFPASVMDALRKGNSFVLVPMQEEEDTHERKAERSISSREIYPVEVSVRDDLLDITMSKPIRHARFIGQEGRVRSEGDVTGPTASATFESDDTYLRAEFVMESGDRVFLNPVFRVQGPGLPEPLLPRVNWGKTLIYRGVTLVLTVLCIGVAVRSRKRRGAGLYRP